MKKLLLIILCLPLLGMFEYPSSEGNAVQIDEMTIQRKRMVNEQIIGRGIKDKRVLDVMFNIPRHLFIDQSLKSKAYGDHPLPIDEGQTISQPYIVAMMTEALNLKSTDRVLEIGTGSGYQAAVLAGIVKEVYSIEIKEGLSKSAGELLNRLGYKNIKTKYADGYFGWEEYAPFDAIIITASANHIPPPLIKQLKEGGRLIIPLGSTLYYQVLTLATKKGDDLDVQQMSGVAFVPMTGESQKKKK
ncbi:MAG: protein-L-isoaspartate(D-aspartate) O-methyltransferase [Nitrospirae bacterium]|nr:protein-L-isoaspartate(D-aspartate) O-methyltransferase [Nitrospirota bacterium]